MKEIKTIPRCTYRPEVETTTAMGMYHCPECGEMVLAGVPHPPRLEDFPELAALEEDQ